MAEPWVVLRSEHLGHNLRLLKETYEDQAIFPVIKAQAYGHGLPEIARALEGQSNSHDVPMFCVARMQEARMLRNAGIRRKLLILSAFEVENLMAQLPADVAVVISSWADLKRLIQSVAVSPVNKFAVHLNFDTGMHRLGLDITNIEKNSAEFFADLKALGDRGIVMEGLMTHLASSEEPYEKFSQFQMEAFESVLKFLNKNWNTSLGPFPSWVHVANSEGVTKKIGRGFGANAARVGLHLWGVFGGTAEAKATVLEKKLKPVLEVHAPLKRLQVLAKGEGVGYGQIFKCSQKKLIGTFALGYADGLPRSLSRRENDAWTLGLVVEGVRMPFAGVISMDLCAVDLSSHPKAQEWEKKCDSNILPKVHGSWICERQRSEEIADTLGTISYEVLCRLGTRMSRVVESGLPA